MKHHLLNLRKAVALMLFVLSSVCAQAVDFNVSGIKYRSGSNNTCYIVGTTGVTTTTLTIPDEVTYGGITYKVTSVGSTGISTSTGEFSGNSVVTRVVMGANVTYIGDRAFCNMNKLATVDLSKSTDLQSIGVQAFYGCPITTLTLPDNLLLSNIAPLAFVYSGNSKGTITTLNIGLTKATDTGCQNPVAVFGDAITALKYTSANSFVNGNWGTLPNLMTVTIATGATIGDKAFCGCTYLNSVSMSGVKTIGDSAFDGCINLTSVTFGSSCTSFGDRCFANTALKTVTAATGATIGDKAFCGCTKLTSVSMSGVKTIGVSAFDGCTNLSSVTLGTGCTSFGARCFANTAIESSNLNISSSMIGEQAFENTKIKYFSISNTPISAKAFNGCTELKTLSISGWSSTLEANTFYGITPATSINITSYDVAPMNCFNGCAADVSIMNLTYCDAKAFYGYTGNLTVSSLSNSKSFTSSMSPLYQSDVKSVTINSASGLSPYLFEDCANLERISINTGSFGEIPSNLVRNCQKLNSFSAKAGVAVVPAAFYNCPALETINGASTGCYSFDNAVNLFYRHYGLIAPDASEINANANAIYTPEVLDLRAFTSPVSFSAMPTKQPMAKSILIKAGTEDLFTDFISTGSSVITEGVVGTAYGDADKNGSVSIADVSYAVAELLNPGATTGTASATLEHATVDVPWVQLWAGGPKFAKYNVGLDYNTYFEIMAGREYAWGKTDRTDTSDNTSTTRLTDSNDTATQLWGSNWRMPTASELQALIDNCDIEWTSSDAEFGVSGVYFKGKTGKWAENKIFLPQQGLYGMYWSADPSADGNSIQHMLFMSVGGTTTCVMDVLARNSGMLHKIRPVLK